MVAAESLTAGFMCGPGPGAGLRPAETGTVCDLCNPGDSDESRVPAGPTEAVNTLYSAPVVTELQAEGNPNLLFP